MSRRVLLAAAAALTALFALSACATGAQYSDLSRVATADDAWPATLPGYAADHLNPESSRLVGHDGGVSLYLAASTKPGAQVCLPIYPDDENWLVSCATDGFSVSVSGGVTYVVRSDGFSGKGAAISANVYTVG